MTTMLVQLKICFEGTTTVLGCTLQLQGTRKMRGSQFGLHGDRGLRENIKTCREPSINEDMKDTWVDLVFASF
jgi:hypothetical protein